MGIGHCARQQKGQTEGSTLRAFGRLPGSGNRIAETRQRSAPSASRTSTNRRNQRLSVATSVVESGRGRTRKLGGITTMGVATI